MFRTIPSDVLLLLALALAWPTFKLAWTTLLWLVARFERIRVTPYAADRDESPLPETPYAAATNRLAAEMGLISLGVFRHAKGGMYRLRYDLWAAPDFGFIATVSSGTVAGLPSYGTRIASRLADGVAVMTVDSLHGLQYLADGLVEGGLLLNADLFELVEHHRRLLSGLGEEPVPFDRNDPLGDLAALREGLVEHLVDDGLARFVDAGRAEYRYTSLGALRYITTGQKRRRDLALRDLDRLKVQRPGSDGYRPSWQRSESVGEGLQGGPPAL